MFRKSYLIGFLTIALFLMGSAASFAQTTAPVRGKVDLKKADGTSEGVAGVLVEVYRVDVKTSFPSAKTDKKGYFNFAGLPSGANLVLVLSAPNIAPVIQGGIKAGMENILIPVEAGDGKRFSQDEVYEALATPNGTTQSSEMTADQKKAKEEYDKKFAEATAKNEKATKANEVVAAALKEGTEAYKAKNYDLAIAKYEEGYNIDPTFVGSASVMLNNKAAVLIDRGRDTYNASISGDTAAKIAAREKAQKDFLEAAVSSDKALELLKTATSTDANVQKGYELNKLNALSNRKVAYRLMAQTGADRTKGKESLTAFQEYIAVEPDPVKKSKAQLDLALTLQDSNEFELAVAEFQKVLDADPNNVDALAGLGLSMVSVGYITMDTDAAKGKAQLQEAANYLQKFVDLAPDTHKYKDDAKSAIVTLKDDQKLTPQKGKTTTTTKKKN